MSTPSPTPPTLAITMGDPAGVGPEIIAAAWPTFFQQNADASAFPLPDTRPVVFGDPDVMRAAIKMRDVDADLTVVDEVNPDEDFDDHAYPLFSDAYDAFGGVNLIPVVACCAPSVRAVKLGEISAAGGDAAFRALNCAISATRTGATDAIVTAPLHKEALHLAGHNYPGHTEILASRCGVDAFGMALYLGPCAALASPTGLGVAHVTLHTSMRNALDEVTTDEVLEKIRLLQKFMTTILARAPRLGVCALNCHAGDGGLFGREEIEIIAPAVAIARTEGVDVSGPYPSDTLFLDAKNGLYDGIVAIYHDQGHIAVKMMDMFAAVNVALGLPIIRTSVAHGTAFNIAGRGVATTKSLVEAVRVAALFAQKKVTP